MMTAVYIFIGGGLGSLARYGISVASKSMISASFPVGTFISNIVACVILAIITVSIASKGEQAEWVRPLMIIGFCGGFSTFSTFGFETVSLLQEGHLLVALLNILLSVGVGVGLIYWLISR